MLLWIVEEDVEGVGTPLASERLDVEILRPPPVDARVFEWEPESRGGDEDRGRCQSGWEDIDDME